MELLYCRYLYNLNKNHHVSLLPTVACLSAFKLLIN